MAGSTDEAVEALFARGGPAGARYAGVEGKPSVAALLEASGGGFTASKDQSVAASARTGRREIELLGKSASNAASAVESIGTSGKFSLRVLEAFFLYRGFVALERGAMNAVRTMTELQHRVALVQTQVAGRSVQGEVQANILRIGRETGSSFLDLADAEYQIVSANVAVGESYRVLEESSKAAIAGNTNISTAFNSALAQANAFGIGMDRISEIYDKQFNLVKRGIFTYEQFANVVGSVSEAFANAGQSLETTNAAMAAISLVFTGPQLNRGATALRNLALAIADTPGKFNALGIAVADQSGNFLDLIDILEQMKAKFDGMTEAQKAASIHSILPEKREGQAIQALLQNLDSLKRNYAEQKMALGDMHEAFETVSDDLKTQSGILKNNLTIAVQGLAGPLDTVVTGVNILDKAMPGLTGTILLATAAVTGLAIATSYLNSQTRTTVSVSELEAMGFKKAAIAARAAGLEEVQLTKYQNMRNSLSGLTSNKFFLGGVGLTSLVSSYVAGRTQGASAGNTLLSMAEGAGSGALIGSAFPVVGPALGAGLGAVISAVSLGFGNVAHKAEDAARLSGKTFMEVFSEQLDKNAGDVAQSFAKSLSIHASSPRGAEIVFFSQNKFKPSGLAGGMFGIGEGEDAKSRAKFVGDMLFRPGEAPPPEFSPGMYSVDPKALLHKVLEDVLLNAEKVKEIAEANIPISEVGDKEKERKYVNSQQLDEASRRIDALSPLFGELGPKVKEALNAIVKASIDGSIGLDKANDLLGVFMNLGWSDFSNSFVGLADSAKNGKNAIDEFARAEVNASKNLGGLPEQFRAFGTHTGDVAAAVAEHAIGIQGQMKFLQQQQELGVAPSDVEEKMRALNNALDKDIEVLGGISEAAGPLPDIFRKTADAADYFANRLNANNLQIEEIQARAAAEGRSLSADESYRIAQLRLGNVLIEGRKSLFDSLNKDESVAALYGEAVASFSEGTSTFSTSVGKFAEAVSAYLPAGANASLSENADMVNGQLASVPPTAISAEAEYIQRNENWHTGVNEFMENTGMPYPGWLGGAPVKFAAAGHNGMVYEKTVFVAGEAGPEHVSITPAAGGNYLDRYIDPSNGKISDVGRWLADTKGLIPYQAWLADRRQRQWANDVLGPFGGKKPGQLPGGIQNVLRLNGLSPDVINSKSPEGTKSRLLMAQLAGADRFSVDQVDRSTLLRADALQPVGRLDEQRLMSVLSNMLKVTKESARRGGMNIYFNGPTVPSELDLSMQQLKRLGPMLVRQASRSR